jgi:eukaryotic-like serine/threonine-protein kinase
MPNHTIASVLALIQDSGLLSLDQLRWLPALSEQATGPEQLLRTLLKRGWLTPYQAREVLAGRGQILIVEDYLLLAPVGEGGTSRVFQARHRLTGAIVAVKVLRPDLPDLSEAIDRLFEEARVGAALAHPNVLRFFEAGRVRGTGFLVMEYAPGVDLARLVRGHGPLAPGRACEYVRQASLGLQHAFERGLVHRDVKPSNLLLAAEDSAPGRNESASTHHIKVLDLGLACLHSVSQSTHAGTPDYLAPERADDPGHVDVRSDVYGLGCTLYHLLTGLPPFPGGSMQEKLRRHLREEPAGVELGCPGLPPNLGSVVRRMMAKSPPDRYSNPGAVAEALGPFVEHGGNLPLVLDLDDDAGLDPAQSTAIMPPFPPSLPPG